MHNGVIWKHRKNNVGLLKSCKETELLTMLKDALVHILGFIILVAYFEKPVCYVLLVFQQQTMCVYVL